SEEICYAYNMHHWQDCVLAVTAFGFSAALIPTIKGRYKPALLTSLGTAASLVAVLVAYASLKLWFSVSMVALNLTAWLTVADQIAYYTQLVLLERFLHSGTNVANTCAVAVHSVNTYIKRFFGCIEQALDVGRRFAVQRSTYINSLRPICYQSFISYAKIQSN